MKKLLLFVFAAFMVSSTLNAQQFNVSMELNPANTSTEQNSTESSFSDVLTYGNNILGTGNNAFMSCANIAVGTVNLPSDSICFLDSLIFSMNAGTTIPEEGEGINGFVWGVFAGDVSGSVDPFNDANFLGAFGGIQAEPIEIAAIYDANLGLPAGTYFITPIVMGGVVDTDGSFGGLDFSNGCILTGVSAPVTLLPAFTPLVVTADVVPVTDPPGDNGELTANPVGGSGMFSYLWSTGATTQTITGLAAGTYTVTVTDTENECVGSFVLEIMLSDVEPIDPCDSIAVGTVTLVDATVCFMDSLQFGADEGTLIPQLPIGINGSVWAVSSGDISGSTDPFNDPGFLGAFGGIQPMPTDISAFYDANLGIPAGTYFITLVVMGGVTDTNGTFGGLDFTDGCVLTGMSQQFILLPEYQALMVDDTTSVDEITPPGANGEAGVTVSSGSGTYTYLWSNGETTATITGLISNTYTVTITDESGCLADVVVEVVVDQIVDVNEIEGTQHLEVFPNPANEQATVSYTFAQALDIKVAVINKLGQVVYANEVDQALDGTLNLDLSSFSNGVYFVRISNGDQQNIRKLVVNK